MISSLHAGSIEVDTQPDEFTEFRITLPSHSHFHREIGGSSVMFLILVVDDEPNVESLFRQHFRRELRAGRFAMNFAQSAPAALQRIAAADAPLILILSDINTPEMSGLEFLLKAKAIRPDIPVITAYGDTETKQKALEGGAEGLFPKPIDFARLRSEIEMRVGKVT
jgi:CheY-like chemotaxis protein